MSTQGPHSVAESQTHLESFHLGHFSGSIFCRYKSLMGKEPFKIIIFLVLNRKKRDLTFLPKSTQNAFHLLVVIVRVNLI